MSLSKNGKPVEPIWFSRVPVMYFDKTLYADHCYRMRLLLDKGANIDAIDKQTNSSLVFFVQH